MSDRMHEAADAVDDFFGGAAAELATKTAGRLRHGKPTAAAVQAPPGPAPSPSKAAADAAQPPAAGRKASSLRTPTPTTSTAKGRRAAEATANVAASRMTTGGSVISCTVYLAADEWAAVRRSALDRGTTASAIVRAAIRAALDMPPTGGD